MAVRDTIHRLGTHQSVAYTGTAGVITNAVGSQTRAVMVTVTTAAHIRLGSAPTATTSDPFLVANTPYKIQISPGEKVSAVQSAAGGTLYVTELDHG